MKTERNVRRLNVAGATTSDFFYSINRFSAASGRKNEIRTSQLISQLSRIWFIERTRTSWRLLTVKSVPQLLSHISCSLIGSNDIWLEIHFHVD